MADRNGKLSKRALEATSACWSAFDDGDRWLSCQHASTWRYTIVSMGDMVETQEEGRRFRLSESYLNLNGLTRATRFFAGITFAEVQTIQEEIETC